jgi:UDP-3-O-[3-hydroxymyristoyl] glucosamine N-acyltransferase
MMIDKKLLSEALGRPIEVDIQCATLGLVDSRQPGTLTFLDDPHFLAQLQGNKNISAVITTAEHHDRIKGTDIVVLISDDPRYDFYSLHNYLCQKAYVRTPTRVDGTAVVYPQAYVSDHNVTIGAGCVIEPMACVMPDVEIGERCIIRAGAVIGLEGYEMKWTRKGVLSVLHTGKVVIQDDVEIGANSCVAKGTPLSRDTFIGRGTKVNGLAFIGHCVSIGKDCLLHLAASVSGSSIVEDKVWIGPKATVSNGLKIGAGARISLGSVVTADVPPGAHVTGNFAIDHALFISNLKKSVGRL